MLFLKHLPAHSVRCVDYIMWDVPADTCRDSNVDFSTKQQQNYYIDPNPLYVARPASYIL